MKKPLEKVCFESPNPFQMEKINKNCKTLLEDSVILSDTYVSDSDDPIEKMLPEGYNPFHSDLI